MQFSWVRRARKLQSITSATLKLPGMPRYLRLPLLLPLPLLLLLVLRHLQWGNFKKAAKLGHFKSLEAEVPTKAIGQKGCQNHKTQRGQQEKMRSGVKGLRTSCSTHRNQKPTHFRQRVGNARVCLRRGGKCRYLHVQILIEMGITTVAAGA